MLKVKNVEVTRANGSGVFRVRNNIKNLASGKEESVVIESMSVRESVVTIDKVRRVSKRPKPVTCMQKVRSMLGGK